MVGGKRTTYRLLIGKPEGSRPLGRRRRGWVDRELGWDDVDWIGLAQDRDRWRALLDSLLKLRIPWNAGKLSSVLRTGDLSSSSQLQRVSLVSIFRQKAKKKKSKAIPVTGLGGLSIGDVPES
jgi:hypothetical protein